MTSSNTLGLPTLKRAERETRLPDANARMYYWFIRFKGA
jgi:hypothetical protein